MVSKITFLKSLLLGVVLFVTTVVSGQTDGDYRTKGAGGNWSLVAIWEKFSSGAWAAATDYPGQYAVTGQVSILSGATVTLNVSPTHPIGSLSVQGNLNLYNQNFTVAGATTITGSLTDTHDGGTNTFGGVFTVAAGGSFSTANISPFIFKNGIVNNGTFNKTGFGLVTFNTNSQSITGNALTLNASSLYLDTTGSPANITLTIDADVTINCNAHLYNYSNTTVALQMNSGSFNLIANGAQNLNTGGGTGTAVFNVLNILGTGTKQAHGPITLTNNFVLSNNQTFDLHTSIFKVNGTTTIGGNLSDGNSAGNNTFIGAVKVNSSGSFVSNATSPNLFQNGIENYGDFRIYNSGVNINFTTNSQNIIGDKPVTLGGIISISDGLTLTNKITDTTDGLVLEGTLNGATSTSTFINEQLLSVRGADGPMLTTGVFNVSTIGNTVRYGRNAVQNITPVSYYNLIIKSNNDTDKYLQGNTVVNNTFTLENRADFFPGNFNFTVLGNSNINGRIYDEGALGLSTFQNVDLSNGEITGNQTGTFIINGNLTMPTASGRLGRGNITIHGNTDIASSSNLTLNNATGTKIFIGKITVNGDWLNSGNTSLEIRNGFEFNGTTFTSGSGTYNFTTNNQSFTTARAVTLSGAVTVGAGITLTNNNTNATTGTTINGVLNGTNAASIFVNRGIVTYLSGTEPMLVGVLDCSNTLNTFNYNSAGNQNVKGTTYDFLQLTNAGIKYFRGDVEAKSSFETSGTAAVNCYGNSLTLGGTNTLLSSGAFTTNTGKSVIYSGLGNQNMMSIPYLGNLIASGSGIKSMTGSFAVNGNVTIHSGSGFKVSEGITLTLANASVLTNNGTLQVVGSSGNPATITAAGVGGYRINQPDATANFEAAYAVFDKSAGITITDGTIHPTNNFTNCIFSNGTGTEYLNLTNYNPAGGFSDVQNAVFNVGPTYNVSRTSGTDAITFVAATGALAGENYDNDNGNPGTLVNWTDPSSVFYSTGNGSANLPSSWNSNADGTGGSPALARLQDGTLTLIVQDDHTVTLDNTGNINVRELIIGTGASGRFLIGGNTTQQTLTVKELIQVNAGGVLEPGSSGEPAHILALHGNMINNGTVKLRDGYTKLVNTKIYGNTVFSGDNSPMFSQLIFEAGSNATAEVDLDVNGNLILQAGATFNDGGHSHKVEYAWINNGGTYNATGRLEFDGGTSSIASTGTSTTFNDVTFNGGGLVTIKQNSIFNGHFLVNNNTQVSVDNVLVTINGNYTVEAGSQYLQLANITYFSGGDVQTITLDGVSSFNRVEFHNGGVNAKTIVGDLEVSDWLMIHNGATVDGSGHHVFGLALRMNGTCNFSGSITMKGSVIETNDPTVSAFTLGTAKLIIESGVTLRHLTPGSSVAITVQNDVVVQASGSLTIASSATLIGQPGNTLTLEAGRNLNISGANNFPDGFGTYNFDPTANVYYNADMNQTVRGGFTYGRLYISNASIKTVDGSITVTGHLYLRSGATLDLQSFDHVFSGSNIYNNPAQNGSINGSNATLTITGPDTNQTIEATGTGTYTFKNLILSQNGATATRTTTFATGCNLTVTNDLIIENVDGTEGIQYIVNLNDNPIGGSGGNLSLGAYCSLYVNHLNFGTDVIDHFASTSFHRNSTVQYNLSGGNPAAVPSTIDPAKNQMIANVTYGNLSLNNGNKIATGSLDIKGDIFNIGYPVFYDGGFTHTIAGDWKLNSTYHYTQASATGTIVFEGVDQDINGRNFNNIIIANSGNANLSSNLNIFGDITVNDGSKFNASTLNMDIGGDVLVLGTGKYTQTDGTTTFNGAVNQSITMNAASYFGNLTIDKADPAGQTVTALSDINIGLSLTVTAMSGIFDITNKHLYVGNNFRIQNNTVPNLITEGSTVVFNGSVTQDIRSYRVDPLVFNNVVFEGSGDKTFVYNNPGGGLLASSDFQVNGNFTINGSTVNGSNVSLYVRGDWSNSGTFNHGSTVYFDGADQTISSSGFYHARFQGTDTKTLTGNISVSYDLYIAGSATLNANGHNITLARTWYNNVDGAGYAHGGGKVVFNGADGANIYTGTSSGSVDGKDFYAIDVNKTIGGYVNLQGDLIVQNDLYINTQILNTGANSVWVGGDFVVKGTYNSNNDASLLTLNANGGSHIFDPNDALIRGIQINAPGATYQMQSGFTLYRNNMIITAGTLDLNKNQIELNDNNRKIDINGGTMIVGPASKVLFTHTQSINLNSGALHISGEAGTTANLESTHATNGFSVNATGGTFYAEHYRVQKGSIVLMDGATLDATKNLSNGTFVEGRSGSSYITLTGLDLGAGISLTNMIFNSGAKYNISRTSGIGTVTVSDASGAMAGAYFEEDDSTPGTLIDWTFPAGIFWDGDFDGIAADSEWHNPLNWSGNTVPGANDIVYLDHTKLSDLYTVNISSADAACSRLIMEALGGVSVDLTIGAGRTLDVTEHVVIGAETTLTQADNTSLIKVGKNWTNQGTYQPNGAKVIFNAASGNYIISSGGVGGGKSFHDLTIDAGTSLYTLDMPTDIQNNLTVTSGTFDLASPNNHITIGGNWDIDQGNGGAFISNKADVTFNGALQSINNGVFYNLIVGGTSTTSLSSNIAVENDVTLNDGSTFNANDKNIYVRGNWRNDSGTFQQNGLGTVVFDAISVAQLIDNGTTETVFNNLTFSNGAIKTFSNSVSVNGNILINNGSGVVNMKTYGIEGIGSDNKFTCNSILQIEGEDNFPKGFETMEFSSTSSVRYYSDGSQNIYPATYGNLSLQSLTFGAQSSVKTALDSLEITGSLHLNDVNRPATLNMAINDANIVLTGTIAIQSTSEIIWGTGNATLEHIGGQWIINENITHFNNLILGGTSNKYTQGNLNISGDLTIKSGVDLRMYNTSGRNLFRNVTGTPSGTISMETGARILNTRPSLIADPTNGGPAIAEGFGTYDFNDNSTYFLYSDGIDQTLYTGSGIAYGHLTFSSTKSVTSDGIADLDVNGEWNIGTATYYDGGRDMYVAGSTVFFNSYVPSSSERKLVLDGLRDQRIYDYYDALMELPNVEFRGTGVKTIIDHTVVKGDLFVDAGVVLRTGYNITFNGSSWVNNGFYQQTGNGLTLDSDNDQTINPGAPHPNNYFNMLVFNGAGTKTFVNNGADVNSSITINSGTVNLGNLDHYFAGRLDNVSGGVLQSANANITLDGANQVINTPNFAVKNITCSGTGIKYLYSDWTIGNNLTIESGATLTTRSTVLSVVTDYNIQIGGDWINRGIYTSNTSKVTFNGSISPVTITSGGSNFYDVEFAPSAIVNYSLLSPITHFRNQMIVGSHARLNLNSKTLNLGATNLQRNHTINGVLTVNADAVLSVNNSPTQSVLDVYGTLNIVGSDESHVATLTSETTANNVNKTLVNIHPGATMAARYYLIEYIADAGLNLMSGSTLHSDNNFSDGTFLNMRSINVGTFRYITLESNYSGGNISNVSFSYSGVPVIGRHYNVQRKLATTPITFENVTGSIGNYRFEEDEEYPAHFDSGLIIWPEITETHWLGGMNSDWHNADNWDNGVPTATMDAIIVDKEYDPVIFAANATCKSLIITDNGKLVVADGMDMVIHDNVLVNVGGVLSVTSPDTKINVKGDWTINTSGNFVHGGGTVTFESPNGYAHITIEKFRSDFYNLTFNNAVTTFNISAIELNVRGNLTINNGVVSPATNNYTYNLYGNYLIRGGSFDALATSIGNIVLNASGNQTVTNASFNNLIVAGSGNKYFAGANTVEGTTKINSTLVAQTGSAILFKGDMTVDPLGTFNDGGATHIFEGVNWRGNGAYAGAGTISFNRTVGPQYLYSSTFNHLIVNCTGRALNLEGDVGINGNLTFKSGISSINLQTSTFTSNGTGIFTAEAGVITNVHGTDNFPKAFATYTMDATSDTRYYGSSNQSVAGVSYGILRLNNISTKTLLGNTTVKGILQFNNATLDVSTHNYSLTIGGHWYNNNADAGDFICREGQVVFNGADDQNIYVGSGRGNDFYRLTVSSAAMVTAANVASNDFIVKSDLNVTSGVFNPYGKTIYVGGDLTASGAGSFNYNNGTYYLNKIADTANIRFNGSTLRSITVNSDANYTVLDDGTLLGSLTLTKGTINGNGHRIDIGDAANDVVIIDGTYIIGAGGVLGLGNGTGCTVGTSGRIEVVGSEAGLAKVTRNSSGGRYSFTVHGTIAAEYYMFEHMWNGGIFLSSSSTIDATHHFSNGTFSNGANSGQLFRVENTQSFTEASGNRIENVSFPIHPGGSASNVAKTSATSGVLEFYNSVGAFAGESFDNDTKNLIIWTGPVQLTWNGSISANWNTPKNWTASSGSSIVPTAANNVFIPGGLVTYPNLTVGGQQAGNLTIEQGGALTISTASGDVNPDLDIAGDFTIKGELSTVSSNDLISVEGNWTVTSTADVSLNGKVIFDGVGGAKQIDNAGKGFYALHISGTTQYQIAADTKVRTNLIIDAGAVLDASPSNRSITVGGDWENNGAFLAQQGTVLLKSLPGTRTIRAGASKFYNLDINSPSTHYNLTSNMGVNEMLQIQKGILDVKTNTLRIGDGTGTDGVSISGTLLVNAGATLDMANKAVLNVNAGGSMDLLGTDEANRATLTSSTAGRYSFNVNSGGSIKARYYNVSYTDADGLHMKSGANIHETYNLSDGIFSNGFPGSGSYMTLMHNMSTPTFTLRNLVFNAGPNYSVTRTAGTTIFYFEDASGVLGNYLYERDEEAVPSPSSGLLRWPFVKLYTWEGKVDNNWLNPNNWFDNQLPVSTSDITIPNTGRNPVIDNSQLHVMQALTIETGATVTLKSGSKLTVNGDLTIKKPGGLVIENKLGPNGLASLITKGEVIGEAEVKLQIEGNRWYYLSSAVASPTFGELGADDSPFDFRIDIYRKSQWFSIYPQHSASRLREMEGFSVKNSGVTNVRDINLLGNLNSGKIVRTFAESGWHMFGNPYPSAINWANKNEQDLKREDISPTIWYRTQIGAELAFVTYNGATNTASYLPTEVNDSYTNGDQFSIIPPYQSVWVKAANLNAKITLNNGVRLHSYSESYSAPQLKSSMVKEVPNKIRILASNQYSRDAAVLSFGGDYSVEFGTEDSEKYFNSSERIPEVFTKVGTRSIAINGLPELGHEANFNIPISVRNRDNSPVTLKFNLDEFSSNHSLALVDNETGDSLSITNGFAYTYTPSHIGENHNRFVVHFNSSTQEEDLSTSILDEIAGKVSTYINIVGANGRAIVSIGRELLAQGPGKIEVYSVDGLKLSESEARTNKTFLVLPEQAGIYVVVVTASGERKVKKLLR